MGKKQSRTVFREVEEFSSDLDIQRLKFEKHMANKWGLEIPNGHPYLDRPKTLEEHRNDTVDAICMTFAMAPHMMNPEGMVNIRIDKVRRSPNGQGQKIRSIPQQ